MNKEKLIKNLLNNPNGFFKARHIAVFLILVYKGQYDEVEKVTGLSYKAYLNVLEDLQDFGFIKKEYKDGGHDIEFTKTKKKECPVCKGEMSYTTELKKNPVTCRTCYGRGYVLEIKDI